MDRNLLSTLQDCNRLFFDALGTEHTIDGKKLVIVLDNDQLRRRQDKDGLNQGNVLYFARKEDFARLPDVDERQAFDGRAATITDVSEDCGILRVVLLQQRG